MELKIIKFPTLQNERMFPILYGDSANATNQNEEQIQFQTKSTKFKFFQPKL